MDGRGPDPFSAEEYFSILLRRARAAEREGNYAIAAAVAARHGGLELIALGANSLFAGHNPIGHAETNAIMLLRSLAVTGRDRLDEVLARGEADGSLVVRAAPDDRSETVLYTTLEPCPMCTVCIINTGIDRVVIAAEDPPSGSLAPERLASLPALWPELALGLTVVWAQSESPRAGDSYISPELRRELIDTFLKSRFALDSHLSQDGALDLGALGDAVLTARRDAVAPREATTAGPS